MFFKKNLKNIIILGIFSFFLLFSSFIWADSNGVWQFANDTRGGIFGGDEQAFTSFYTFINPVKFGKKLISLSNPSYYLDIDKNSNLNNLTTNTLNSNKINTNTLNSTNISTNTLNSNKVNTNLISSKSGGNIVIQLG